MFRTVNSESERQIHQLGKIAQTKTAVLIRGETGTGKDLISRAIHDASARRGPFVPISCGALPRSLIESELFGHKPGAFSGANEKRDGLVRYASGGTLFLDEIAELSAEAQVPFLVPSRGDWAAFTPDRSLQARRRRAWAPIRTGTTGTSRCSS